MARRSSVRPWMMTLLVLGGAVGPACRKGEADGCGEGGRPVPILLTVMTNPQTRVLVQSPETDRPTLDLGDTPIDGKSGTRVGDTVVLANPAVCIRHEETIQFGEAGKVKIIEKVFGSGKLNMSVTPELEGLAIWCGSLRLGPPGTLELYEGKHRLELRGGALRAPVEFVVTIEPNRTTTVARPIDLSTYLQK